MVNYNINGVWKTIKNVYVNVSGSWKTVGQIYTKVNGSWKPLWSYRWNTGGWGNCSASCGGGTQTRTVTCVRNDNQTVSDALCTKFVGTKPATSQTCNTGACTECKYQYDTYEFYINSPAAAYNYVSIIWGGTYIAATVHKDSYSGAYNYTKTSGGYKYYRGSNQQYWDSFDGGTSEAWDVCRTPV